MRGFVALLLSLLSVCAFAQLTTEESAARVDRWSARGRRLSLPSGRKVARVVVHQVGPRALHEARFESGGFAVLAADENGGVIAFSDRGELIEDAENPLWALLKHHEALAEEKGVAMVTSASGAVSDVRVAPLLKSKWGQGGDGGGRCYNYYTPNNYVCGCVATAMAQIMRYHEWPKTAVTVVTNSCSVDGVKGQYEMKGGVYDWDNMPYVPADGCNETEREAIGRLTYDCGVAVHMSYTANESGTYGGFTMFPYRENFGYASAFYAKTGGDGSLSASEMRNALLANLDAKCPVELGICRYSGGKRTNGHQIVADGYGYADGVGYVHLNLGWNGSNDAWYALPDIGTGYGFNLVDSLTCNIFPKANGTIVSGCITDGKTRCEGLVVAAYNPTESVVAVTQSDSNGVYAVILPEDQTYRIVVRAGEKSYTNTVTTGVNRSLTACDWDSGTFWYEGEIACGNRWGNDFSLVPPKRIYVDVENGSDVTGTGEIGAPFATITNAVATANEDDAILVAPGRYHGCVTAPLMKLSITSSDGPDVTFIDGDGVDCCYDGSANGQSLLAGFTLEKGAVRGGAFGGTLSNCVIRSCWATNNYGGGAYNATLQDCLLVGNEAYYGGGASCCTLTHCTVTLNTAYFGSGVDCDCICTDSIVWANYNVDGNLDNWEWYEEGWWVYKTTFTSSCTSPSGFWDGGNNVLSDPLLAAPARSDVRLMTGSPCVGTASDGQNMGCWQGVPLTNAVYSVGPSECDFATLQEALNVAVRGDSVRVQPAIYRGVTNYAENISIVSLEGVARTVLDGAGRQRCFDDYGAATLVGFTLVNGAADRAYGGGAYGGTFVGCVISNCSACSGGGVAWSVLTNCLVVGNRATGMPEDASVTNGFGGGACNARLFNCTLAGNSAYDFGGGALLDSGYDAVNTIVSGNICDKGYDNGNDVYGNAYWTMVCSLSNQDAKFVDAARGDYRLSARSPCIDVGTNAFVSIASDLDGTNRIVGARVDMGCYEYCHTPDGWPTPVVESGSTSSEEAAAVSASMAAAGFSSEQATAVTTLKQYNELSAWAEGCGVKTSTMAASPTALISAALDADALLSLTKDDLKLTELTPASDGQWTMKLSLEAYDEAKASPGLLKAAVGVVGSETPSGSYTKDNLALSVSPAAGAIEIKVTPPVDKSAYFLKSIVR